MAGMASSLVGRVRHVVLFGLKPGTTGEHVDAIARGFLRLRDEIPQIRGLEWGSDNSPENRQAGHTHAFLVTFDSAADRDAYLPHPARMAFLSNVLRPHLEKATVLDYVAREGFDRPE
jgi:hypothetical protein